MYPLHKYVPTSFGTYLMYINHGPERVTVQSLPKDVKAFKNEWSKKAKKLKELSFRSPIDGDKDKKETIKLPHEILPSYQIRFLRHTGQTVTEPPSNIIIVDDITGADVTSSMSWIRNRPKRWKDLLKTHEIENPEMTNTVKMPPLSQTPKISYPAGEKLLNVPPSKTFGWKETPYKPSAPPRDQNTTERLQNAMQPHVTKTKLPRRSKEMQAARDEAAYKRRRKANKIMQLVSNRARFAKIEAQKATDQTVCTRAGTITESYLSQGDSLFSNHKAPHHMVNKTEKTPEELISSTTTDSQKLRSRATLREDLPPQRIQDWNPRKDQEDLNKALIERMDATMPYQWTNKSGGKVERHPITDIEYRHVL